MKHDKLQFHKGFRVSVGNTASQGAVMVIEPGDSEGGPDNRHSGADQWLFVQEGAGLAIVNGQPMPLTSGSLLLIEAGDTHEIRNTSQGPLKTVNIYLPPAYASDGDELPPARG